MICESAFGMFARRRMVLCILLVTHATVGSFGSLRQAAVRSRSSKTVIEKITAQDLICRLECNSPSCVPVGTEMFTKIGDRFIAPTTINLFTLYLQQSWGGEFC